MKSILKWTLAASLAWATSMSIASAQTESEKETPPAETEPSKEKAAAEDKPATTESDSAEKPEADASPDKVLVTVNGETITQGELDSLFETVIKRRSGGQGVPPKAKERLLKQIRPRLIQTLVDDALLSQSAKEAGIKMTEEEMRADLKADLDAYLLRTGTTTKEFEKQLERGPYKTVPEFIDNRVKEPDYSKNAVHKALLESKFADKLKVTDEQIEARHTRDKERIYSRPAQVRASHILILSKESDDPETREKALNRANEILEKAKEPDADFAALASEFSEGPSKSSGGDLGFFPRKGAMVEPFAKAAFDLKVGEVSDVVETQFGFHIIKVTDRNEADVVTVERAKSAIERELRMERIAELRNELLAELKETAKIEYAEGEAPPE